MEDFRDSRNPYEAASGPDLGIKNMETIDNFLPSLVRNNQTVGMIAKYYNSAAQKDPRVISQSAFSE